MDLSVVHKNQEEAMGIQNRVTNDYGSHLYSTNETFEQTDVKRNNNLFNPLKTETINDLGLSPSSLFQDLSHDNKNNFELKSTLCQYSTFKKAVDLSIHNRGSDDKKKTIFEDADYFAKNYSYKLLPITFENVDETIIHTEHNYCHFSMSSESDMEEDCSRTMDYSQVKEKNYKRRKTKHCETVNNTNLNGGTVIEEQYANNSASPLLEEIITSRVESKNSRNSEDHSLAPQPLDLSAPLVQEKKTDHCLREHQPSIVNNNNIIINNNNNNINQKEDGGEFDSDKENHKSNPRCIEVTITRPDEKENYQPCDLFLNDIAKLVPRLIGKDCFEIDILDKTCDRYVDMEKHRLYYIISESTWRLFQSTNERVILTNDQSLGQPIQKMERDERPTFLVFDQISLAKCLADYCNEIGGCFEYTCVEEKEEVVEFSDSREGNCEVIKEMEEDVKGEHKIEKIEVQSKDGENVRFQEEHATQPEELVKSHINKVEFVEPDGTVEKSCENLTNRFKCDITESDIVKISLVPMKVNSDSGNEKMVDKNGNEEQKDKAKSDSLKQVTQESNEESELVDKSEVSLESKVEERSLEDSNSVTVVVTSENLEKPVEVKTDNVEENCTMVKESEKNLKCNKPQESSQIEEEFKVVQGTITKPIVTKTKEKNLKVEKSKEKETKGEKVTKESIISRVKTRAKKVQTKKKKALNRKKPTTSAHINSKAENEASNVKTRSKSTKQLKNHNDLKIATSQKSDSQKVLRESGAKRKSPEKLTKSEETPKKLKQTDISTVGETPRKRRQTEPSTPETPRKRKQSEASTSGETTKKLKQNEVSIPTVNTFVGRTTRSRKSVDESESRNRSKESEESEEADQKVQKKAKPNEVVKQNVKRNMTGTKTRKVGIVKGGEKIEKKAVKKKVEELSNVRLRSRRVIQNGNFNPKQNDVTQGKKKLNKPLPKGRKR